MNIWKVDPDVSNYRASTIIETEEMDILSFGHMMWRKIEEIILPDSISFQFLDDDDNYEIGDIMYTSMNNRLINKKAKDLIEKSFKDLFHFIKVKLVDEPEMEWYIILPLAFVDAIDMEKSQYKYFHGTDIISKISTYVFNEKAKQYPFFRLMQPKALDGKDYYHHSWRFANDEFKEFIEQNHITGLEFKKVFEFED